MGGGDKDTLFFLNKKTAFEAKMDRRCVGLESV